MSPASDCTLDCTRVPSSGKCPGSSFSPSFPFRPHSFQSAMVNSARNAVVSVNPICSLILAPQSQVFKERSAIDLPLPGDLSEICNILDLSQIPVFSCMPPLARNNAGAQKLRALRPSYIQSPIGLFSR